MASAASVQQVLSRFLPELGQLDVQRQRVCRHLLQCRTAALGGRQLQYNTCLHEEVQYFSCRDRHCPQCQWRAMRQWAERQRADVLPVPYHHVVFTLPHQLNGWVQLHPELIYRLLFQSVWGTLDHFGRDPKRLNGQLGMTAVLHTWGQTLDQHVHLHCLVPAGALGRDGRWRAARSHYLFPVRALSRRYRGLMVSALRQAASQHQLQRVTQAGEVGRLLNSLMATEWVYSKHCLQHTSSVIDYLARYTRRIAISNARLRQVDEHGVTFVYKDYRQGARSRQMKLRGDEFVRRLLLHILPKGLMRVRHYGFLANRCRRARLGQITEVLRAGNAEQAPRVVAASILVSQPPACSQCKRPHMYCVGIIAPNRVRSTGRLRRC